MRIGTAGWSIPKALAASFPGEGQHLARYARVINCVEINSSFHRPHRPTVYERWAGQTPASFRFSVKLPRAVTHERGLRATRQPLRQFMAESSALGDRLAVLLVQLPPSLAFDARVAHRFFDLVREMSDRAIACEPRHASWFTPNADLLLARHRVARVAADPARWPEAARPGGWLGDVGDGHGVLVYHRWHGAPRVYWSRYDIDWLRARAETWHRLPEGADVWCIFDNTASGAALANALELKAMDAQATGAA